MASADNSQAFIDETLRIPGAKDGVLAGLTVAIKDLFDVCNMLHIYPSVMQHLPILGVFPMSDWASLGAR